MSLELLESARVRAVEVLGDEGPTWCEYALAVAEEVVDRLGLVSVSAVGGGRLSAVWRADAGGKPVAVKVPMVDPAAHLAASRALGESGCGPAVLVSEGALVSEWIDGGPVPVALPALHRVADLAADLGEVPVAELVDADAWLRARLVDDPVDVAAGTRRPSMVQRTLALRELDGLVRPWSFCHGDLHAGNVVWTPAGFPVLIDPRGIAGEFELDCANLALQSRVGSPVGVAESLAAALAGRLGRDSERAMAWVRILRAARV